MYFIMGINLLYRYGTYYWIYEDLSDSVPVSISYIGMEHNSEIATGTTATDIVSISYIGMERAQKQLLHCLYILYQSLI